MAAPYGTCQHRVTHVILLLAALSSLATTVYGQTCDAPVEACDCVEEFDGTKRLTCKSPSLDDISQLPNLYEETEIKRGNLPILANRTFVFLNNLKRLILDNCNVEIVEVEAFSQLSNLERLELKTNDITNLPDYVFQDLTRLKELSLSDNVITSINMNTFFGLDNLETLNFESNSLTTLPYDVFTHLRDLQHLILDSNEISSLPSTIFQSNPLLTTLSINRNKLADLHHNTFNSTLLLKEVSLERNTLTTMSDTLFAQNYNINMINLKDNTFVCDCEIAPFRIWASSAQLLWTAEQSGTCGSYDNLKGQFLLNVQPEELICTTTTSTTTTTTTPTTTTWSATGVGHDGSNGGANAGSNGGSNGSSTETKEDKMTLYIIIGCCAGGAVIIAIIVGIAICCRKPKKQKPRQVKYILKPNLTDQDEKTVQKPFQNGYAGSGNQGAIENHTLHTNPYNHDSMYKPNILPNETNLDGDLRHGYHNHMYTNEPETPTNFYPDAVDDGMQFYNSLSKSIAGASIGRDQQTPLSMLHRATPVHRTLSDAQSLPPYSSTRATPVSPYNMPESQPQWREGQYYDHSSYGPQASVLNYNVAPMSGEVYGGPAYSNYYLPESDCNGKYSTGSADSGVHSNSPIPRPRTPTDFLDHQISLNDQYSPNKKTVKNETYV